MRRRTPPIRDSVALSGWLFADLMLAVALLFFAASSAGSITPITPTPTSPSSATTAGSSPSPSHSSPPPSPTSIPETPTPAATCVNAVGLDDPITRRVGPGGRDEPPGADQLIAAFEGFSGSTIGLVLAIGYTETPIPRRGADYALSAVARLRSALPELFSPITQEQYFAKINTSPNGRVEMRVFLISSQCE